jgi:hypothetical protein
MPTDLKNNKKVEFFFCEYKRSEKLSAILAEKSTVAKQLMG